MTTYRSYFSAYETEQRIWRHVASAFQPQNKNWKKYACTQVAKDMETMSALYMAQLVASL